MNQLASMQIIEEIDNSEYDSLTGIIIGAAIDVHRALKTRLA